MIRFIGEPLSALGHGGGEKRTTGIATIFPADKVLVTIPGIHATQRMAYGDQLDRERQGRGLEPFTEDERVAVYMESVDLFIEGDTILIRPEQDRMELALTADQLLQELFPAQRVKFLRVNDPFVREVINHRGEAWRIQPLPRSDQEIAHLIETSRLAVHGRPIYYYSAPRGTRVLTLTQFRGLSELACNELRAHLVEISELARGCNRGGCGELELFMCGESLPGATLLPVALDSLDEDSLRHLHADACARFAAATPEPYHRDNPEDTRWRNKMYRSLVGLASKTVADEDLLGLGDEYYMQIHWLSGARMEADGVIVETGSLDDEPDGATIHELICNVIRDYAGVSYMNIGKVVRSLSRRVSTGGRREVYVVQFRPRGATQDELHIIRFHKWGVQERLDEGKPLLQAIRESDEYTDYILDRRLACRQLGMNLTGRVWTRKIQEPYWGRQREQHGTIIWSPYIQREYVAGVATDKVPKAMLADSGFAVRLAVAMGRAAAVNLIVGRASPSHKVVFDDGDELLVTDPANMTDTIVVADPTGAFTNFENNLADDAGAYALPVINRKPYLADPGAFAGAYLGAFVERFGQIQASYHRHPRAFETLFQHRRRDPAGNLAHRWAMVLERLVASDPAALASIIRREIGHDRGA